MSTLSDLISGIIKYTSEIFSFIFSFFGYAVEIITNEPIVGVLLLLLCCKIFVIVKDVFL